MKNRYFRERLEFALAGMVEVWRRESSFRAQVMAGVAAIAAVALLRPGYLWAGLIAASIALVLALEMVNSAIEYMIDHIHPDVAPEIRRAKDVAAGAVLVASAGALIVSLLMVLDWR
jgi:diacylglycerol kinase (ATP)